MKTHLYGIIGQPLGHSLSPALHNWAFNKLEHAGLFSAWPVPSEKVQNIVDAVRLLHIQGLCVTIPHKETVVPFLDKVSVRALRMGAVNTLYWQDGLLCGENTDVDGFILPLRSIQDMPAHKVLVLGAGGAARAVLAGLQELGVQNIALSNHSAEKARTMAQIFAVDYVSWQERTAFAATCIINTTPLGMQGVHIDATPFPAEFFRPQKQGEPQYLAYDLVYNPLETRFLREAKSAGWQVQDGLDMFVGQALQQMRFWTGQAVHFQEARRFLEKLLF